MNHAQLDLALLEARPDDPPPRRRGPGALGLAALLWGAAWPPLRIWGAGVPPAEAVIVGLCGALGALVLTTLLGAPLGRLLGFLPRLLLGLFRAPQRRRIHHDGTLRRRLGHTLAWLLGCAPLAWLSLDPAPEPWAVAGLAGAGLLGAALVWVGAARRASGSRAGLPEEVVACLLGAGSQLSTHERALLDRALAAYGLVQAWLDPHTMARRAAPPSPQIVAQGEALRRAAADVVGAVADQAHRAVVWALQDDGLPEDGADWRAVAAQVADLEAARDVVIAHSRAREPHQGPDLAAAAARLAATVAPPLHGRGGDFPRGSG